MGERVIERRTDPRCLRTRAMLQAALSELMGSRSFERISIAQIADAATLNRATFYDHYADKFALLDDLVAARFNDLLARRGVAFDGGCNRALPATILAVCDYLASTPWTGPADRPQDQSHFEAAVVTVVRRTLLAGMRRCTEELARSSEMLASAASWAMYGAAKTWLSWPDRGASEDVVGAIAATVSPILAQASWLHEEPAA